MAATVERFGGVDACVNNASAIDLSGTEALELKRYDLMEHINTRGTLVVKFRLHPAPPAGGEPAHPHAVATDQPRGSLAGPHVAYTITSTG